MNNVKIAKELVNIAKELIIANSVGKQLKNIAEYMDFDTNIINSMHSKIYELVKEISRKHKLKFSDELVEDIENEYNPMHIFMYMVEDYLDANFKDWANVEVNNNKKIVKLIDKMNFTILRGRYIKEFIKYVKELAAKYSTQKFGNLVLKYDYEEWEPVRYTMDGPIGGTYCIAFDIVNAPEKGGVLTKLENKIKSIYRFEVSVYPKGKRLIIYESVSGDEEKSKSRAYALAKDLSSKFDFVFEGFNV